MIPEEYYGGSLVETSTGDVTLQRDKRTAFIDPPGLGQNFILPDARTCTVGMRFWVINRSSTGDFLINLQDDGGTTLVAVLERTAYIVICMDNTTADGVWNWTRMGTGVTTGTLIPYAREFYEITIEDTSLGNVRTVVDALGYGGTNPVFVNVEVKGVVRGALTGQTHALDTGTWPALSTIRIHVNLGASLVGLGGDGGNGQNWVTIGTPAQDGVDGLVGLRIQVTTQLVNDGLIGGGGGGGGGGGADLTGEGNGGGGGGGAGFGDRGLAPDGGSPGEASHGQVGTVVDFGEGGDGQPTTGAGRGGNGGLLGLAGAAGTDGLGTGGAGGDDGDAIQITNGVTLYQLGGVGFIHGSTVTLP